MCAGGETDIAGGAAGIEQIDGEPAVDEDAEGGVAVRGIEEADGCIARRAGKGKLRKRLDDDAAGVAGECSAALAGIRQGDDGEGVGRRCAAAGEHGAALAGIGQRRDGDVAVFHRVSTKKQFLRLPPFSGLDTSYSAAGGLVRRQSASMNQ